MAETPQGASVIPEEAGKAIEMGVIAGVATEDQVNESVNNQDIT
jgi:hypothetical protein